MRPNGETDFHPYTNSYVRVQLSQLRKRLNLYYQDCSAGEIRLLLPLRSFQVSFEPVSSERTNWYRLLSQAKLLSLSTYSEELQQAINLLSSLIAAKPNSVPALAALSTTHLHLHLYAENAPHHCQLAMEAAGQAYRLNPDSAEAQLALASCLSLLHFDWHRAGSLFQTLSLHNPRPLLSSFAFQLYLVATGQLKRLRDLLESALNDGEVPARQVQLGYALCLLCTGELGEARQELQTTAMLFPHDYLPWVWLAVLAYIQGDRLTTRQALKTACSRSKSCRLSSQLSRLVETIVSTNCCAANLMADLVKDLVRQKNPFALLLANCPVHQHQQRKESTQATAA